MAKREPSDAKLPTRSRCFCAGPHPEPAGSLAQHSCTHLETRPAGALRGVPGDARASACGSSLWPLPPLGSPPSPRRRSAPSGRSGRTPGGARHCPAGEAPRAPVLVERGPFQPKRLEKGSSGECGEPPAHTRLQNLQQSPRFATVKDPREGRAGGARAGSGGVGRGAWRSILACGPQGSDGAEAAKPGGSRQGPEPTLTRGCE